MLRGSALHVSDGDHTLLFDDLAGVAATAERFPYHSLTCCEQHSFGGKKTLPAAIWHNLPVCGRYRLSRRKQLVAEYFDAVPGDNEWNPRYNIAPTQPVLIIRQHPKEPRRELSLVRWGLIPSWARDTTGSAQMINARSETAVRNTSRNAGLVGRNTVILDVPGAVGITTVQKVSNSTCYRLRNSGINLRSSALSAEAVCTRRLTGLAILPALPRAPNKSS